MRAFQQSRILKPEHVKKLQVVVVFVLIYNVLQLFVLIYNLPIPMQMDLWSQTLYRPLS